ERGKLIMACGTGKTMTSLKIAEKETKGKGLVLFLVPSIALIGQTLREWSSQADEAINAVCICSDPEISKDREKNDHDGTKVTDLAQPASTDPQVILNQFRGFKDSGKKGMTVVFSTYQSIEVISRAQKVLLKEGFPEFDLIICDEAHRTTGFTLADEDESAFIKVHNKDFIKAKKRLYMTATPRLYDSNAVSQAAQKDAVLCSMDDEKLYGKEIDRIGFGAAVAKGLLTDYKVLILTLSEKNVPVAIQKMMSDKDNTEIEGDDATKLIGCINALSKQMMGDMGILEENDPEPMRRAVAFCQSIKKSKQITGTFNSTSEIYVDSLPDWRQKHMVTVSSKHVDGTMGAPERDGMLNWLKEEPESGECRVLTNVRCLSEGVDVPSLDGVMFLSARNSQVDVVQSVGRVMRLSPKTNKKYGYIIIPVIVPSDVEAAKALDKNERFKVVWTVLNALRAHDDRFNATINKIELNKQTPNNIIVGGADISFDEAGNPITTNSTKDGKAVNDIADQLKLQFGDLQGVIYSRLVEKVGDRRYWEQWAKDVADIAQRQIERINFLISERKAQGEAFNNFLAGLQQNINPSITKEQAVEMLAQHIITKPIFEALFEGYSFVKTNAVSSAMQGMLDVLEGEAIGDDHDKLQKFYESVRSRAEGIDNAEGRQKIIIELYDKFFKNAFPMMVEQLGIVYTPVEVVDFIIHSVNDVLKQEFGRSLSDENIHILDPFTGTGTFMTRLLQSGLIEAKDLARKYRHEMHANEIVLLAYYIAAINIETAFHDQLQKALYDEGEGKDEIPYEPFEGIVLTDTFQLGEKGHEDKLFSEMFPQNSARVARQKKAPLRVIIGNPPYSVGQKDFHDFAQNQEYPFLESRIEATYASKTTAFKKSLYDAYIKAFRWSTDRLDGMGGIIAFVSNGSWIDGQATAGFRIILEKEFSSIWVFNLRGNQRTSGELSRKEGGKIFGSGSRTPIAITLLVKDPSKKNKKATIHYHDIGDYLSQQDKLKIIRDFVKVTNPKMKWKTLNPNEEGDWINHRNEAFSAFHVLGDKKKTAQVIFPKYSAGVITNRESWVYQFSKAKLRGQLGRMIDFYNQEVLRLENERKTNPDVTVDKFVAKKTDIIKWDQGLMSDADKAKRICFEDNSLRIGLYRPFFKQNLYFDKHLNWSRYQLPSIFPTRKTENLLICVMGTGGSKDFSTVITDCIPDRQMQFNGLCFPLYHYEERSKQNPNLFEQEGGEEYTRRDGVSDFILKRAKEQYGAKNITKEDIFYYVYGFLHSPDYRTAFANDLKKMLPRLPLVEDVKDFWAFSKAGRHLAELHINYETVPPYDGVEVKGDNGKNYRVQKMRFPKKDQKESIIYNAQITIDNIPAKAYEYVVNGKSAIEWIMERYQVKTDPKSNIKNDPNDWADEVGNQRYILDLLLSVINVSVQSVEIVEGLPKVEFEIS
ncbi:MAG: DEAD/DEAH box helicase family protein, partial [Flavobacteriales bacterium]|nr:DEAD/DEAH box helicase family protein [Flavobacteriales bacterium]